MDTETARLIAIIIAAVGAVVWLISLQFLLSTLRQDRERQRKAAEVLELTEPAPPNCIVGSAEVDGQPAELAVKAAALLAKGSPALGSMKILERTDKRVVFEDVGVGVNQQGRFLKQGQL